LAEKNADRVRKSRDRTGSKVIGSGYASHKTLTATEPEVVTSLVSNKIIDFLINQPNPRWQCYFR